MGIARPRSALLIAILTLGLLIAAVAVSGGLVAASLRNRPDQLAAPLRVYPVSQVVSGQCPAGTPGVTGKAPPQTAGQFPTGTEGAGLPQPGVSGGLGQPPAGLPTTPTTPPLGGTASGGAAPRTGGSNGTVQPQGREPSMVGLAPTTTPSTTSPAAPGSTGLPTTGLPTTGLPGATGLPTTGLPGGTGQDPFGQAPAGPSPDGLACYQVTTGLAIRKVADIRVQRARNTHEVAINLLPVDRRAFAALTRGTVGREVAFVVRDRLVTAPKVEGPVTGGKILISGKFSRPDAERIVRELRGT